MVLHTEQFTVALPKDSLIDKTYIMGILEKVHEAG